MRGDMRSEMQGELDMQLTTNTTTTTNAPMITTVHADMPTDGFEFTDLLSFMDRQVATTNFPIKLDEEALMPHLDTFFARLHGVIPVFSRGYVFQRIARMEHRTNPQFGAMVLSMCAFALVQPVESDDPGLIEHRMDQANSLMTEAVSMRNTYDFGEHPTLEASLASFFLFACLFGKQQHNAAWFRLQEAVLLAELLGLHRASTYQNLSPKEREMYLRTYWVLSVTERAYALQRKHPIGFRGHPGISMQPINRLLTHENVPNEGVGGLNALIRLFDMIDEHIVDCWNEQCPNASQGKCTTLDKKKALAIYQGLNIEHLDSSLTEIQQADIFITQQWLRNRVWQLCLSHGFLEENAIQPEQRIDYAAIIAQDTLAICQRLSTKSMEVHGIGFAEKLYDIATSVVSLLSCFPWLEAAPTNAELSSPLYVRRLPIRGCLNGFLAILATFRGGQHPYLVPLMRAITSSHIVLSPVSGMSGMSGMSAMSGMSMSDAAFSDDSSIDHAAILQEI